MDEFIIQNFFGKLAKSFYKQKEVSDKYESISEFGIGIFSYFLVCDFFEVETKMESKEALKFRVIKDAESSFFFYDNFNKEDIGTRLTIFLNEKPSFENLKNKIKHYFRFVDIPIILEFKDRKEIINAQEFIIKEEDLNKMVGLIHKDKINELCIISKKINNDDFEGIIGIIIGKDKDGNIFPVELYDIIKDREETIDFSQQGIYIHSQNSRVLSYLIGKINIKKKKMLNLSRTNVIEYDLQSVISNFEVEIIDDVFSRWETLPIEDRADLTKKFISVYVSGYGLFPEKVANTFVNNFVVETYNGGRIMVLILNDFLKNKFMIVNDITPYTKGNHYDFSNINTIYQKFKIPIIMSKKDYEGRVYLTLFKSLRFNMSIDSDEKNWFYIIEPKLKSLIEKPILGRGVFGLNFNNKQIIAFPHIELDRPLNLNHPIVRYIIQNKHKIMENQDLHDLVGQFVELLQDFIFNFHNRGIKNPKMYINNMNEILEHINKNQNTNFIISKEDFAPWVQENL